MIPDVVIAPQSDEGATSIGSSAGSDSASGSNSIDITASSSEANSAGDIPVPPSFEPALVVEEPNRWCVRGQFQLYKEARMLNENDMWLD